MAKDRTKKNEFEDYLLDIFSPIADELTAWEVAYQQALRSEEEIFSRLGNYILSAGGKKIRPALVLLCAKAASAGELHPEALRILVKVAASVELIHTATLIHDDIIDNAQLRRKKPTVNTQWGEEYSILFGDYLFSKAVYLLSELERPDINIAVSNICKVICEGEARQLRLRRCLTFTEEEYLKIIESKTASLMSTAAWLGAHVVEAKEEMQQALSDFGLNLGLAFQIVDDCLDIVGKEEEEGKSLGQDLETGKLTLPCVYLVSFLSEEEKKRVNDFLSGEKKDAPRVKTLAFTYRAVGLALKKAKQFSDKAKRSIAILPKSEAKDSLIALADFILERLAA